MLNRKIIRVFRLSLLIAFLFLSFSIIHADAGPKPQIILTIKNVPNELYYVDLLVQNNSKSESLLNLDEYDSNMIEALKSQESLGWYPALVNGTQTRMMGDIIPDSDSEEAIFTYTQSIPDTFKVIVVTQSGKIIVSDKIETKAFLTRLELDAITGDISSPNWLMSYLYVFLMMLIPTFIVEGLLLIIFKLFNRHNIIVSSITNLVTQIFLLITSAYAYYFFGLVLAILVVMADEFIILIFETIIYANLFKHPSTKRKILYGLCANILSFIVGLVLAMYLQ